VALAAPSALAINAPAGRAEENISAMLMTVKIAVKIE
jgi:hypothetical protein